MVGSYPSMVCSVEKLARRKHACLIPQTNALAYFPDWIANQLQKYTQHNATNHNDTQHNCTDNNDSIMSLRIMILSIVAAFRHSQDISYSYTQCHQAECYQAECHQAECHQAECHQAECHQAECHQAECHYAECHEAECHQAKHRTFTVFRGKFLPQKN